MCAPDPLTINWAQKIRFQSKWWHDKESTSMENLPVEVISHIFKFLTSINDRKACSLVCRSWYEAYQHPIFRNYEALHITADDKFQTLVELKNEDRKYLHIVIKDIEIPESSFQFWERFGSHIKTLSMLGCDIREKTFVAALKKCEQLEVLSVQSCRELFMIGRLLEDKNDRETLKEKLKSLTSLNLSYNRYLSDAIFVKFINMFQNITKLLLSGCQISFFSGLYKKYYPNGQHIPSECVLTFPVILNYIQRHPLQLKYLSFSDTFIDNVAIRYLTEIKGLQLESLHMRGCFQLSHEGIDLLSKYQKSLTELDVSLCPRITDGSLLAICSGLINLKSLSLQRCKAITDLGIASLWQLTKLEYLNVSECDLIEGEGITKGLCHRVNPNFKELRISHLGNMTDETVVTLSKCLPNLRVLDLGFCYNAVTNKSVQSILENNRYLKTLILTMCEKLTDSGLTGMGLKLILINRKEKNSFKLPLGSKAEMEIVREAKLKQEVQEICEKSSDFSGFSLKNLKGLQHLNLCGCNGISDLSVIYAFELNELRTLNLGHCNGITEDGLLHLSKNNRAIETLNLDLCQNVNNEGVLHVVKNLKRLETFILGSNKITDSVAALISRYAKGLTYLDIRNCGQVSSSAIEEIVKSLPRLQNFHFSSIRSNEAQIPIPPVPIGLWLE